MNPRLLFPSALLAGSILFACSDPSLCVGDQCGGGSDASLGDGGPTGDATIPTDGASSDAGMQGDGIAPPHCDTSMDISTQSGCVVDSFGLFVDSNADVTKADGTMAHPYATITAALGNADVQHARIFACAGTYGEHVVVSTNVSLYGGFECSAWGHSATTVTAFVKPTDTGPALFLSNVNGVVIEDLQFDSVDGEAPGETSVAVVLSAANDVVFRSSKMNAGDAGPVPPPGTTTSNHPDGGAAMGLSPVGAADPSKGVLAQMCAACADTTFSSGGASGTGTPTGGSAGLAGGPPADGGGGDGLGGTYTTHCNIGDDGANSSSALGGAGAPAAGSLVDGGAWRAATGIPGGTASVAQGGGGGSGGNNSSNANVGAGGGGGCGGGGGGAGRGGGSSFGVLVFLSSVTFDNCTITAGAPSNGGNGGDGQAGQAGGFGGTQSAPGCQGGTGGMGGNGGGGGGGAAGISVGIGWTGTQQPKVIGAMPTVSSVTAKGGLPGMYGGATRGIDGTNAAMTHLPSL